MREGRARWKISNNISSRICTWLYSSDVIQSLPALLFTYLYKKVSHFTGFQSPQNVFPYTLHKKDFVIKKVCKKSGKKYVETRAQPILFYIILALDVLGFCWRCKVTLGAFFSFFLRGILYPGLSASHFSTLSRLDLTQTHFISLSPFPL